MKRWKELIFAVLGSTLTGFAVSTLLTPNKIVCGGVSGVSTILFQTLGVPLGVTLGVANLVLLLLSWFVLGKDFVWRTLVGTATFTVAAEIFSYLPALSDNTFLATVFGGVLYGFGVGVTLAMGYSTGGTDILGRLFQVAFPHSSVGSLLRICDGAVILSSLLVFRNVELVLFGIISLFISTFTIDYFIGKLNVSKMVFVITEKGDEIAHYLVSTSPRGVTLVDAVGAYSNEPKKMMFCVMKSNEVPLFQKKILEIDPGAFIVYSESTQIQGNGFRVYR